uniref:ribonucleotide-diphosphate reductase subunit beta n=1 Tax=Ureibacillus sp. FSL K6-3587 TaxID=2954681 RepID=UPI00406C2B6C
MKTYLMLNNEVLNHYRQTGRIDLEKDRQATRQFFFEYIHPRMRQFSGIEEKVRYLIEEGYYEEAFLKKYSMDFIRQIFEIAYAYRFRFQTFMSAKKFYDSYAMKSRDGKEILETYEDRMSIIALYLADGNEQMAEKAIRAIMEAFQPATPTALNSGKKARGELVSCFKLSMDDSMNSIAENIGYCLELSRLGGGVGVNLTDLRPFSYIFTTLCNKDEIEEIFQWVKENGHLQYKAQKIAEIYQAIQEHDPVSLWKAMFASVMLESFLFYSGFFYPLYLGGQGILRNSAEVISLILRDESIHGVAVGIFAQNLFNQFTKEQQESLKQWGYELLLELYDNELQYTDEIYRGTGLEDEVKAYIRYNGNKALMNLGLDTMFPEEEINPIVMNGIRNEGSTYDFFSQKGSTYALAKVEPITDDTFRFDFLANE